jgi:hypothetical protein
LAVVMLHETFTVLQAIGSALMLGGSLHYPEQCRQGKEEGIGPANGSDAHPDSTLAGGAGGLDIEADFSAARVLRLHLRSGCADVLWRIALDGPSGPPTRT